METMRSVLHKQQQFRRAIMRRIWWSFLVNTIVRPSFMVGFVLAGSGIAFWRLASISSIVTNLLAVEVGDVPNYAVVSMINADTWSLLAFCLLFITTVVAIFRLFVRTTRIQSTVQYS